MTARRVAIHTLIFAAIILVIAAVAIVFNLGPAVR